MKAKFEEKMPSISFLGRPQTATLWSSHPQLFDADTHINSINALVGDNCNKQLVDLTSETFLNKFHLEPE